MTDHNTRALIGGNNPPPFDAEEVEKLDAEASQFLDAAAEWIEMGEITSEDDAQLLNDFINGLKKRKAATDSARAAAKKPHDDAGKQVQAAFKPIITKLEAAVAKTTPILTQWLEKKDAARQAEIQRQQEEARRALEDADRKAAQAAVRGDISGEIEAEAARKQAVKLSAGAAKLANAKANVSSATGGGRTASLRNFYTAQVTNVRAAFLHYQEHPALIDCLRSLAEAEARSKTFDPKTMKIPGVDITVEKRAV